MTKCSVAVFQDWLGGDPLVDWKDMRAAVREIYHFLDGNPDLEADSDAKAGLVALYEASMDLDADRIKLREAWNQVVRFLFRRVCPPIVYADARVGGSVGPTVPSPSAI